MNFHFLPANGHQAALSSVDELEPGFGQEDLLLVGTQSLASHGANEYPRVRAESIDLGTSGKSRKAAAESTGTYHAASAWIQVDVMDFFAPEVQPVHLDMPLGGVDELHERPNVAFLRAKHCRDFTVRDILVRRSSYQYK